MHKVTLLVVTLLALAQVGCTKVVEKDDGIPLLEEEMVYRKPIAEAKPLPAIPASPRARTF